MRAVFEVLTSSDSSKVKSMALASINHVENKDERLDKPPCDRLECFDYATENITIKAGKFGSIEVSVCRKCKDIIKRKEEMFSENESLAHPFSLNPTKIQHRHNIQSTGDSMHV